MRLSGLIPAVFTPMKSDGSIYLERVGKVTEYLLSVGVNGLFVCGTTGEGFSLSTAERRAVAECYAKAVIGRCPLIVQVGHNSVEEARLLAQHAESIGADAIAAVPPSYYDFESVSEVADCLSYVVEGAPSLPFYYYHIPSRTGVEINMLELLSEARTKLPSLAGVKYSDTNVPEFRSCAMFENGRYNMLFGSDEMLLSALAAGAKGGVGSTYNFAAPLYQEVIKSFRRGDLKEALRLQDISVQMVKTLEDYPFQSALKAMMTIIGVDCGPPRLPQQPLRTDQIEQLRTELDEIGLLAFVHRE